MKPFSRLTKKASINKLLNNSENQQFERIEFTNLSPTKNTTANMGSNMLGGGGGGGGGGYGGGGGGGGGGGRW